MKKCACILLVFLLLAGCAANENSSSRSVFVPDASVAEPGQSAVYAFMMDWQVLAAPHSEAPIEDERLSDAGRLALGLPGAAWLTVMSEYILLPPDGFTGRYEEQQGDITRWYQTQGDDVSFGADGTITDNDYSALPGDGLLEEGGYYHAAGLLEMTALISRAGREMQRRQLAFLRAGEGEMLFLGQYSAQADPGNYACPATLTTLVYVRVTEETMDFLVAQSPQGLSWQPLAAEAALQAETLRSTLMDAGCAVIAEGSVRGGQVQLPG